MRTTASPKLRKPLRYAMLLRCSSDDQAAGDFTTIDSQRQINRRFIEERIAESGGTFTGEYIGEGKSGKDLKRPDWTAAYADAKARKFDVLVISYMSRLARGSVYHAAEYLLHQEAVRVVMVKENFGSDTAGRIQKDITILGDGLYIQKVSEHTKAKQSEMMEKGFICGGHRLFGFNHETAPGMADMVLPGGKVKPAPKVRVPHPDEAPLVVRAFQVFSETDNMGDVQRYLRSAAPERTWSMDAVRRLLTQEAYIGIARFGELVNYTAHPRIVSEGLWDIAQANIKGRQERPPEPRGEGRDKGYQKDDRKDDTPYYLRGRVWCLACGSRMTPGNHHGKTRSVRYYECIKGCKGGAAVGCPTKRVNAETLTNVVLEEITRAAAHPTRLASLIRDASRALPAPTDIKDELTRLARNQRETERKIRANIAAIEAGGSRGAALSALADRIAELEVHKEQIAAEIAAGQTRLHELTGKRPDAAAVAKLLADFADLWNYMTEPQRERAIGLVVEKVEMITKNEGNLHLILQVPFSSGGFSANLQCGSTPRFYYSNASQHRTRDCRNTARR